MRSGVNVFMGGHKEGRQPGSEGSGSGTVALLDRDRTQSASKPGFPVFSGSHADNAAEFSYKAGGVVEPYFLYNCFNGEIRVNQKLLVLQIAVNITLNPFYDREGFLALFPVFLFHEKFILHDRADELKRGK